MKYIISILLLILLTTTVTGLGISPPRQQVNYAEGQNYSVTFTFINNGDTDNTVRVFAEGPFSERVSFSKEEFTFSSRLEEVTASFTLPKYDQLSDFGKKTIRINGEEISSNDATFNAVTAVEGWIEIFIPLPGKFSQLNSFTIPSVVEGEDTTIETIIRNRGLESLENTQLVIEIFAKDELYQTITKSVNLSVDEIKSIDIPLKTNNYVPGKYTATLTYSYDNAQPKLTSTTNFFVGTTDVDVVGYTSNVLSGEINRVNITFQSLWNEPLAITRVNLVSDGNVQKLPVIDLLPFEEKEVELFIDVPKISSSTFDANLELTLLDNQKSIPLTFVVKKTEYSPIPLLIIGIVGIIGGLIVWMKRKR